MSLMEVFVLAHLIKLDNYVSRYQYDIFRYQSQYSRLKKERWERLKLEWDRSQYSEQAPDPFYTKQSGSLLNKLAFLKGKNNQSKSDEIPFISQNYRFKFTTIEELKHIFFHELFQFQLKWASSTLLEKSTIDHKYTKDPTLKWLCKTFPDNYLVLYKPSLMYPKALVQFDILLVGPTDVWCMVVLESSKNTIYQTDSERYWIELTGDKKKKIINPMLSINRMSTILSMIMSDSEQDMSIKKIVLTKEGYIDVNNSYGQTLFIDQRSKNLWVDKIRNNRSPLKSTQLKFAQNLLQNCQTNATKRQEFEHEKSELDFD